MFQSHPLSTDTPVSPTLLREIAQAGALHEISNQPGAVRHYVFHHGLRDPGTGRTRRPLLFVVYQTERHGPQHGYRLCLVHEGFHIASAAKEGEVEDDIDRVERPLALETMQEEFVVLGKNDVPVGEDEGEIED